MLDERTQVEVANPLGCFFEILSPAFSAVGYPNKRLEENIRRTGTNVDFQESCVPRSFCYRPLKSILLQNDLRGGIFGKGVNIIGTEIVMKIRKITDFTFEIKKSSENYRNQDDSAKETRFSFRIMRCCHGSSLVS